MSARVFVHPRCHEGPALATLTATLKAHGRDTDNLGVSPMDRRGRRELVRKVEEHYSGATLERMDGTRYRHFTGWPAPCGSDGA